MWWIWVGWAAASGGAGTTVQWSLPSGMNILHVEDDRFPTVQIVLGIPAGTADSAAGQRPLPHLAEHLWFRTLVDGHPIDATLRAAGCYYNAQTELDSTIYLLDCPKDAAPRAMKLALTLVDGSPHGLTDEVVAVEEQVVLNETEGDLERGPAFETILDTLFPSGHPYNLTERVPDDLLALRRADVEGFYRDHYRPKGSVLAVGGDITQPELARLFTQAAGDGVAAPGQRRGDVQEWPYSEVGFITTLAPTAPWFRDPADPTHPLGPGRSANPILRNQPEPPPPTGHVGHVDAPIAWPEVFVSWYLPAVDYSNYWDLEHAATFATVDLKRALAGFDHAFNAGCSAATEQRGSLLICATYVEDEDELNTVSDRMAKAFDVPYSAWRQTDLEEADDLEGWLWEGTQEADGGGLYSLLSATRYRLATGMFNEFERKYGSVGGGKGLARWRELYPQWLTAEKASVVLVSAQGEGAPPVERARSVAVPADLPPWPVPDLGVTSGDTASATQLSNGLRVVTIPARGARVSAWRLIVPQLPGQDAVADLVDPGLRPRDQVDGYDLYYRWTVRRSGPDTLFVANQMGTWDPKHLLRGLWGTLTSPRTPGLSAAFRHAVRSAAYQGRSPYGWRSRLWKRGQHMDHELDGLTALSKATHADVGAYLDARFRPERSTLVVTGTFRSSALERITEEMGDWDEGQTPSEPPPGSDWVSPDPEILVLDSVGANTRVDVSWTCPLAANHALRQPNAWLLANLLQERLEVATRRGTGLTYSPHAWVGAEADHSSLYLVAETSLGQERSTLDVIRAVAEDLALRPANPSELATARRMTLAEHVRLGSSILGLGTLLTDQIRDAGSLEGARIARQAMLAWTAPEIAELVAGCGSRGVGILIGPVTAVVDHLDGETLPVRVFDWRQAQLDTVGRWWAEHLPAERKLLERSQR